jgi:hypothetical protein
MQFCTLTLRTYEVHILKISISILINTLIEIYNVRLQVTTSYKAGQCEMEIIS